MSEKSGKFEVVEASIDDLHNAIRAGETTLVEVVQGYIDRARAYNGVASMLVTEDGLPVPEATGVVRAGAALKFPTETIPVSDVCPISTSTRARRSNMAAWKPPPPNPMCSSNSA